jgi:ADP-ribose pyrophosphatase YjhB (NUDIX family)
MLAKLKSLTQLWVTFLPDKCPRTTVRLARHAALHQGMSGFVCRIPEGDHRERMICADCGYVAYENPKVIVGAAVVADDAVLLCRRAIEPRHRFWTLPAGFLELGETLEEGAARETWEEAQTHIELDGILGIFSISRIGQVHVMFRARFAAGASPPLFAAGAESLEVGLFTWNEIPWDSIAFPSTRWTLGAAAAQDRSALQPPTRPKMHAGCVRQRRRRQGYHGWHTNDAVSQLGLALPLILAAAPMHRGALPIPPIPRPLANRRPRADPRSGCRAAVHATVGRHKDRAAAGAGADLRERFRSE